MTAVLAWTPLFDGTFHRSLAAQRGSAVVVFGKPGCGACRHALERVPELARDRVDALFYVDVEVSPALARAFDLFHLPTLVLYVDGVYHAQLDAPLTRTDWPTALQAALVAPAQEEP